MLGLPMRWSINSTARLRSCHTPEEWPLAADIGPGIRSFVVGKTVMFYRVASRGLDVGRVMHGARDIAPEDVWVSFETPADEA
jgi:plasmid stabilization system protein ParE